MRAAVWAPAHGIVGEVLVGLRDLDPESVRQAPESWSPSATLIDLLAGVDGD